MVQLTVRTDASYYPEGPKSSAAVGTAYEVIDTSNSTPDQTLDSDRSGDEFPFESNVEAELYGILQGLQAARRVPVDDRARTVIVKCDCRAAIESLSAGKDSGRGEAIVYAVADDFYSVSYEEVAREEMWDIDDAAGRAARLVRNS